MLVDAQDVKAIMDLVLLEIDPVLSTGKPGDYAPDLIGEVMLEAAR